jgi:nucleoside-diphosphate-sugar epimerase
MRFDLTVNEFVMKMLIERAITVYGEQFWRPYVHVRDAAAAIEGLLAAGPVRGGAGAIFNVGDTAENYTKRDLIELIQARTGPAEIRRVEKLDDPRSYKVSFERIRSRFGYSVKWRVPDGINEIASAIESNAFPNLRDPVYYN